LLRRTTVNREKAENVDAQIKVAGIDVSGLVVYSQPMAGVAVQRALAAMPGVAVHAATPEGKLVVTLETASESESVALCERIRALEGVASVAMVYHQLEDEPDKEV